MNSKLMRAQALVDEFVTKLDKLGYDLTRLGYMDKETGLWVTYGNN